MDKTVGPEWLLLTALLLSELPQAQAVVRRYARCWLTEDFHKTLKTGLEAEHLLL